MAFLRKRGAKWYYTIEVGSGTQRKRVERVGGRTKKEAAQAYARALAELTTDGAFIEPTTMTVDEYFASWLDGEVDRTARANTARAYRSIYRTHIAPVIGGRRLRDIRPRTLQTLLNNETCARSTLSTICTVLKQGFAYAIFCDYLRTNPAQGIRVPKDAKAQEEVSVFTRQQLAALFARFPVGHDLYLPMMLAYHTGARAGEVLALKWEDVDLARHMLRIHATVVTDARGTRIQPAPKSANSVREIVIGEKLHKILKAARAQQAAARLQYGEYWQETGLVCTQSDGRIMGTDKIRYFNMYCRDTFGPGLTFHSLRHTHATMLLEAGEDLELVSKRLGHGSIATTARVYSHILDKRRGQMRATLDQIL